LSTVDGGTRVPLLESVWNRVELVPMDPHCSEISVALYRQDGNDGPVGLVHTYSSKPGAAERVSFLASAMGVLGGLERADGAQLVRFPCRGWHNAAAKRLFLEACKLDPSTPLAPRAMEILDRKTGQGIRIEPLGAGTYRVAADDVAEDAASRAPAIANGLAKLGELTPADEPTVVSFPCGHDHDALVALLLPRALNVRAVLREEETTASRGVLVAPSAQAGEAP
jgi:hypothetical protein